MSAAEHTSNGARAESELGGSHDRGRILQRGGLPVDRTIPSKTIPGPSGEAAFRFALGPVIVQTRKGHGKREHP